MSPVRSSYELFSPLNVYITYPVLVIRVQINAAPLSLPPMLGHAVIDVRLVNDLGDQLRSILDQRRIGSRYFGAVNGVGGPILDEESEESENGADEEDDDDGVDDEEDGEAAAHLGGGSEENFVRGVLN